jgi:hypothetical protein
MDIADGSRARTSHIGSKLGRGRDCGSSNRPLEHARATRHGKREETAIRITADQIVTNVLNWGVQAQR